MIVFELLLIFSFFACNCSWKIFYRGRLRYGNLGEPNYDIKNLPLERYFEQKLNHFDSSNVQVWNQRYFVNDTFYKTGGPFFLMIGGEAEVSSKWMVEGTWLKYAEKYNAFCVMVEHRFYGKSRPTEDLSVKNLSYLSSDQALADLAYFITMFNEKLNLLEKPKWIVMGGSYSGALAAWLRLKYPHLVYGAVSTSAPLLALPDFKDYFKVVRDSLSKYNKNCVPAIQQGTSQISQILQHIFGRKDIFNLFKLCDEIDLHNENDLSNLFESLADNFAGVVQYNKDNRHSNGIDVTIDLVCDIMLNKSLGSEINRLAAINALILQKNNETCLEFKYDKMIEKLRSVDWKSEVSEGSRQWSYQTCTEFGFFQTSSLNITRSLFGNRFPLEFFVKQCTDIFGHKFGMDLLKKGVQKTNILYGGLDDRADNIIYVHGSIDPWHVLGITKTLRKESPAIFIEGTAHCANMYPSSPRDPPQLMLARHEIKRWIGKWLENSSR